MLTSFHLLGQAAAAARSAKSVEAYVTGGALTEALQAVGDVHFRSAIDHLRQAQQSSRWADRVADAASEMQTAYFAFEAGLGRGVRSLRPFIAPRRLQDTRGKDGMSRSVWRPLRQVAGPPRRTA